MAKLLLLLACAVALAACHVANAEKHQPTSRRAKVEHVSNARKPAFLLDVSGASAMLAAALDASPGALQNDNDDEGDPWPRLPPRAPLPPHDPADDPSDDPEPPPTIPPPGRAPLPPPHEPGKGKHPKPPSDKPAPIPGPPAGPPKHRNPGNKVPPDTGLPGSTPPPERDLRPVYNRLLHAETRALFIPPLILLALVGVHTALMYAAAAHRARRNAMLLRHGAAATGAASLARAEYGTTTHATRAAVYPAAPGGATAPNTDATDIAGEDLTRRDVAEHAVGELVREARGYRSSGSRPGTGDEAAPLLGQQQQRGVSVGLGESVLGGGGAQGMEDESDPITDLWDEFTSDADHATALDDDLIVTPSGDIVTTGLATRAILVQRDGITAVKNGGHVAMFSSLLLLGMAVLASFGATMLPSPTSHDDAVGSRDRTLALVTAEWGILGAALVWAYAETTMLAVHDLNRARVGATLVMLVLTLVYGVQLNNENLARLHGVVAGPDIGAGPAPVVPPLHPSSRMW